MRLQHARRRYSAVRFAGIDTAGPTDRARDGCDRNGADTLVIAPSNPIVSIGPVLAVPGVTEAVAVADRRDRNVAVSPDHRRQGIEGTGRSHAPGIGRGGRAWSVLHGDTAISPRR